MIEAVRVTEVGFPQIVRITEVAEPPVVRVINGGPTQIVRVVEFGPTGPRGPVDTDYTDMALAEAAEQFAASLGQEAAARSDADDAVQAAAQSYADDHVTALKGNVASERDTLGKLSDELDGEASARTQGDDAVLQVVRDDAVNFLTAYSVPRDGSSDVGAVLTLALAETAAAGQALIVPNKGFIYRLLSAVSIPANARLVLRGVPLFATALSTCFSVTGADAAAEGKLRIAASHNGTGYHVVVQAGADRFEADTIKIDNGNSGVAVFAADCDIGEIVAREMRGTAFKFSGTAATNGRVGSIRARNAAGFCVFGESSAARNTVGYIEKYSDAAKFTAWHIANRPETSDGRLGLESLGLTFGCDGWTVGPVVAIRSGDAGASLSSNDNVVASLQAVDCALNGLSMIGSRNKVLGGSATGCQNGASFTPNAGGTSKSNILIGFVATTNRGYGIQNNDASNYVLWTSGRTGSATSYCRFGLNVYRAPSAISNFGTTAPTHTSGTVSDGVVSWTWVNSDPTTLDADGNVCIGCAAAGNAGGDWNQQGAGRCLSVGHPADATSLGSFASFIPSGTSIAAGAARGAGGVDLQINRLFATQTASGADSFVAGKNNRASQANAAAIGSNNVASSTGSAALGGDSNTVDAPYASIMGGRNCITRGTNGARAHANGRNGTTDGSRQTRWIPLSVQTSDATATKLTSDGGVASTSNRLILPNACTARVRGEIVCRDSGGNSATWDVSVLVKRGANAASTAIVGTATVTKVFGDSGASTYTLAVAADTTAGGLDLIATGAAGVAISWHGEITAREVQNV